MFGSCGVLQVFNACWTCDDQRIVTLQTVCLVPEVSGSASAEAPTRLKVWCAVTGDLLRIIGTVSTRETKILSPHPRNPHVAMTAGRDGCVGLWNIECEQSLWHQCITTLAHDKTQAIADATFSPDATRIGVTDVHGHIYVIGLDDASKYDAVPAAQYFSTDYAEIVLDGEGQALDLATQQPVHMAPRGHLCDHQGIPHDNQPPPRRVCGPLSRREVPPYLHH